MNPGVSSIFPLHPGSWIVVYSPFYLFFVPRPFCVVFLLRFGTLTKTLEGRKGEKEKKKEGEGEREKKQKTTKECNSERVCEREKESEREKGEERERERENELTAV